ncbi:MAG: hypothetical protein ACON38_00245 [Akkermansiaceae bacterium]
MLSKGEALQPPLVDWVFVNRSFVYWVFVNGILIIVVIVVVLMIIVIIVIVIIIVIPILILALSFPSAITITSIFRLPSLLWPTIFPQTSCKLV